MDRLHLVIAIALTLVACDPSAKSKTPEPKSRVNAVVAKKHVGEAPEEFCDTYFDPGHSKPFRWPELNQAHGSEISKSGWTWVNVWATWCKPCIEEMPRLVDWKGKIDGLDNVVFLSADDTDETLDTYLGKHPEIQSGRLRVVSGLKEWNVEMGFDAAAPLPLHLFVDTTGNVRCVRAGGVSEHNQDAVARLVKE